MAQILFSLVGFGVSSVEPPGPAAIVLEKLCTEFNYYITDHGGLFQNVHGLNGVYI